MPVRAVVRVCEALLAHGAFEVALSDTIGVAHPGQVRAFLRDTARRPALVAGGAALPRHPRHGAGQRAGGARRRDPTFDACAGGLGGCPFAPGAAGNLATEDLVYMLHGLGLAREIDLEAVVAASALIEPAVEHVLPSRYYRAARATLAREAAVGAATEAPADEPRS